MSSVTALLPAMIIVALLAGVFWDSCSGFWARNRRVGGRRRQARNRILCADAGPELPAWLATADQAVDGAVFESDKAAAQPHRSLASEPTRRGRYMDLLQSSGLVEGRQAQREVAEVVKQFPNATCVRLGRELVQRGLLTPWQDAKLQRGRHRGFFLGKYKLLDSLGGGICQVFLGEHCQLRRRVAIKVLPRELAGQSTYVPRLQREAQAIAMLKHPNMIEVLDVGLEKGLHYIVMPYVAGHDLGRTVQQSGPLDCEQAASLVMQAAAGLHHAHEHGIIHRDVKPANLVVDTTGTVKVLDLGLARITDAPGLSSLTIDNKERLLGTVDYLAPEQAQNSHEIDHRVDIYALGCTLYFLLTGRPPFSEGKLIERLIKHQLETPASICSLRPEIPTELAEICERMMAKRPEDRYQSMDEVRSLLSLWLTARANERAACDTQDAIKVDTRVLLRRDTIVGIVPQPAPSVVVAG